MATIEPYETKAGKRYMVRYRTPDRRATKRRGFKNKREAQDWLAENTVKMNAGEWRPATAGKITVAEFADQWLETKTTTIAPKTATAYEQAVTRIKTVGTIGATSLARVDHSVVEQWVSDMSRHTVRGGATMAPKTIQNTFSVLSSIMKRAVRDNRISRNPCEGIELPKVYSVDQIILTPTEVAIMATAAGNYGDMINALAMAGLRWGELVGLQVQDVDLNGHRLRINRQITEDKGRLIHGLPKHDKKRNVPLLPPLATIIEERIKNKPRDALVFTTTGGQVLRASNSRRDWFNPAAEAAGHPGLTPHDLRHTFASTAISAGANILALQHALGHHSPAFTLSEYGHLYPDDIGAFINTMGNMFT